MENADTSTPVRTSYRLSKKNGQRIESPYLFRLISEASAIIGQVTGKYGWVLGQIFEGNNEMELTVQYPEIYSNDVMESLKDLFSKTRLDFYKRKPTK